MPAQQESDHETVQIHIEDTDAAFRPLAEAEVAAQPGDLSIQSSTVRHALTTGGELSTEGEPVAVMNAAEHRTQVIVMADRAIAIGYFLFGLETHGIPEADALAGLAEQIDLTPYTAMLDGLTERDRRMRLMDLWEWRSDDDWAAARYFNEGATWRERGLTDSGRTLAESIERHSPVRPRQCYLTAGEAAIKHLDNHRVAYVEGMALPKQACQAIRHAWIEIDGKVCELTWPWHRYDGAEAVYIGVEIPKERVKATRERREINGAIVLSDEEIRRVGDAMRGEA